MQARRRAQPSGTNSPSSSHRPSAPTRSCRRDRAHAAARARARAAPGGSIPHERNLGAGDHPIPSRTRQLSPASPKVLRRKVAGGQGVPLMGDGFGPAAGPGKAPDPTRIRGLPAFSAHVVQKASHARDTPSFAPARSSAFLGLFFFPYASFREGLACWFVCNRFSRDKRPSSVVVARA